MRSEKFNLLTFFFILSTIPLVFGARHALVHGLYSTCILITSGTWLIFNYQKTDSRAFTFNSLAPLLILLYVFLTTVPLPLPVLGFLTPVRTEYLLKAIKAGGLDNVVTSLSYYAPVSMFYVMYGTALVFFYYAIRYCLGSKKNLEITLWIITVVGLFESVYGLLQVTNPALGVLWLPGDMAYEGYARGTIIYRNQYAAFLNMCWPMSLALGISLYKPVLEKYKLLLRQKENLAPADRVSLVFQKATIPLWSAGIITLGVIFSGSRGGILAMSVIAVIFLFFVPFSRRMKTLCAGALLAFIIVYGSFIGFEKIMSRFAYFYDSAIFRMHLWYSSLAMLKDHYLTGIGMGSYEFLSPFYLKNVPDQVWFDRAHNEYVELAVELGIPVMLLLFVWIIRGMASHGIRLLKSGIREKSLVRIRNNEFIAIGAFCGIFSFLLHAVVDFIWRLPANVVYAVILLAILNRANEERKVFYAEG